MAEQTTTENVCSKGIRILTGLARDLDERLIVTSPEGNLQASAGVVYCQKLPDGRFGVGLQFEQRLPDWAVVFTRAG